MAGGPAAMTREQPHPWDRIAQPPESLVTPVPIGDPTGPTRGQAPNREKWRRTSHGLYVPAYVADDMPEQRILEQSMRLPTCGAVTGWAACRLHGAAFFDGLARDGTTWQPIPLALGPAGRIREDSRAIVSYRALPAAERCERYGIAATIPERALLDHLRLVGDRVEAVVGMDMALAARITSKESFAAYAGGHRRSDRARARWVLARCSADSLSPNETRLRMLLELEVGLTGLLVNHAVRDEDGRLLGVADLLCAEAGLVIEYDGADHRTPGQHARDIAKDEALREVGLEVLRVTSTDLRSPQRLADRVRRALARAEALPGWPRRWTVSPAA